MKQQQEVNQTTDETGRRAAVLPFRPLRAPLPPLEDAAPPLAPRRLSRSRKLWGREDGFTMSGTRS